MRKKELRKKIMSGVCFSMLSLLIGCGANGNVLTDHTGDPAVSEDAVSENVSGPEGVSENALIKERIMDFDAQVNGEWKESAREYAEAKGYQYYSTAIEKDDLIEERVMDILDNTDISSLDPGSDLYKTIYIYRQLKDASWRENEADAAIKSLVDRFDKVKNLNELYEVYADEYYGAYNPGMSRKVIVDVYWNVNYLQPRSICGKERLSEDQEEALKKYLIILGFSEDRADEIMTNAVEMDGSIVDFLNDENREEGTFWYDIEDYEEELQYPLWEILSKRNAVGTVEYFGAPSGYIEFLNSFYTKENALKIRDYSIVYQAYIHALFADEETMSMIAEAFPEYSYHGIYDDIACWIVNGCGDILAKEYNTRYISEADYENTDQLTQDIVKSMSDILHDSEWFSTHTMEQARKKAMHFEICIGENGVTNDLSALVLSEDPMENVVALRNQYSDHINSQLWVRDDDRKIFDDGVLVHNAHYYPYLNAIIIDCGCLDGGYPEGKISYEEELGRYGMTIAHELAHAYDPQSIWLDYEGDYEPILSEEEEAFYEKEMNRIADFFDGMEFEEGYEINGEIVKNEAFADLLAMKCCLHILEGMDDPDYDAFFKAYAEKNTGIYTKEGLETASEDSHLPYEIRVNYIPVQFDEFYETYDVALDSPYYVPEEQRLDVF